MCGLAVHIGLQEKKNNKKSRIEVNKKRKTLPMELLKELNCIISEKYGDLHIRTTAYVKYPDRPIHETGSKLTPMDL